MDLMTILGWVVGLGSVLWVLGKGETIYFFLNVPAMVLVFGGTIGATLITYPWTILNRLPHAILLFIFPGRRESPDGVMARILNLAGRARRTSMESLENDVRATRDHFLANGL